MIPVVIIDILSKEDMDLTVGELERGLLNQLRFYRTDIKYLEIIINWLSP